MPITGHGGNSFLSENKNGVHTSDECYKMATTDALSVAMKMLGMGAEIYAGHWDGSKYSNQPELAQQSPRQQHPPAQQRQQPQAQKKGPAIDDAKQLKAGLVNSTQLKDLCGVIRSKRIATADFNIWMSMYCHAATGKHAADMFHIPNSVYPELYDTVLHDSGKIHEQAESWRAKNDKEAAAAAAGDDGVA